MYLAYFDENKYSEENPYFVIGGFLVSENKVIELEKTLAQIMFNFFGTSSLHKETELHGKDMFHGKGNYKNRNINERLQLFEDIATFVCNNQVPVRLICINVEQHRKKYNYPQPEYSLGLQLLLEQFSAYIELKKDLGVVFGDIEKDQMSKSVVDFSEFKKSGTPMYFGRNIDNLIDTVYYTQSHHSRFIQLADVIVYMTGRYEHLKREITKWHDKRLYGIWKKIKANTDIIIKRWP